MLPAMTILKTRVRDSAVGATLHSGRAAALRAAGAGVARASRASTRCRSILGEPRPGGARPRLRNRAFLSWCELALAIAAVLAGRDVGAVRGNTPAARVDRTASSALIPPAPILKRARARRMDVEDRRSKVATFLAVTGTEDAEAAEAMLEGNGWNVEGAIDFFFATGTTGADVRVGGGAEPEQAAQRTGGAQAMPGGSYSDAPLVGADESVVGDEDHEMQMALAASMGHTVPPLAGAGAGRSFQPPNFPPPFQPPSDPIPPHLRRGGRGSGYSSDDDQDHTVVDPAGDPPPALRNASLPFVGVRGRLGADGLPHNLSHAVGMQADRLAGSGAMGGEDDATDAAFLEVRSALRPWLHRFYI